MKIRSSFLLLVLLTLIITFSQGQADQFKSTGTVEVYFFPDFETTNAIFTELNDAKSEFLVQAYSFTIPPIANAPTKNR